MLNLSMAQNLEDAPAGFSKPMVPRRQPAVDPAIEELCRQIATLTDVVEALRTQHIHAPPPAAVIDQPPPSSRSALSRGSLC